jgi:hypothetical protein
MAQAKDGRHLTQLGNAEIRAAKKFRKLAQTPFKVRAAPKQGYGQHAGDGPMEREG